MEKLVMTGVHGLNRVPLKTEYHSGVF